MQHHQNLMYSVHLPLSVTLWNLHRMISYENEIDTFISVYKMYLKENSKRKYMCDRSYLRELLIGLPYGNPLHSLETP